MTNNFTYVGFFTGSALAQNRHQWKLYDLDLIKQDLLNHFNTRVGQRLGRPTWGSRIWQYLMAQRTDSAIEDIEAEIRRVCDSDRRIAFLGVSLTERDRGIIAYVDLVENATQTPFQFSINFDERQTLATRG